MKYLGNTGLAKLIALINEKFAPLNSPAITGVPTAPTAASGTNTTQLATTAFVQNAVLNADVDIEDITNTEIGNAWNNISIDPNVTLPVTFNDLENYVTKEEANSIARYTHFIAFKLDPLNVNNIDISDCTSLSKAFYNFPQTSILCSNWDTSSIIDMDHMFSGCSSLTSLDISNWDTSSVINMNGMFSGCRSLTSLDMSNWDTSSVTDMSNMFNNTFALQYIIINSPTFKFQAKSYLGFPTDSTCKILVPSALISTYQSAANWAPYASKFDAIENYTITRSNGQITVTPNT
jgi:surface protein